ncbi:MAG: T9SS type A sorting domain-containing protein, partial [Prevotellaceae bacterium]|nr:T9SS type A sorting domain-containing protein [Prevotellaceae bacterium]
CYWNSSVANYYIGPENLKAYVEGCYFDGKPSSSNIFKSYGGSNAANFVGSYGKNGLPSSGSVSKPSYSTPKVMAYGDVPKVVSGSCGAGATLQVNASTGAVSSSCGGGTTPPEVKKPTIALSSGSATQTVQQGSALKNVVYKSENATGFSIAYSGANTSKPSWLTANISGNTLTFSGTPSGYTSNQTLTIKVKATNGSDSSSELTNTISITVQAQTNPGTLALTSGNTNQTVNKDSKISNIVYTFGGSATGATVKGLPAGVGASTSGKTVTISGTPTATGTFNYTITTTGAQGTNPSMGGKITVNAVSTPPTTKLGAPVATYSVSGTTATVNWTAVANASSYLVKYCTAGSSSSTTSSDWNFNDSAFKAGAISTATINGATFTSGGSSYSFATGKAKTYSDGFAGAGKVLQTGGAGKESAAGKPSTRYISFAVNGPAKVTAWFFGNSSGNRSIIFSAGTSASKQSVVSVDAKPVIATYNYTGGAGTIYVYADNSINISRIKVESAGGSSCTEKTVSGTSTSVPFATGTTISVQAVGNGTTYSSSDFAEAKLQEVKVNAVLKLTSASSTSAQTVNEGSALTAINYDYTGTPSITWTGTANAATAPAGISANISNGKISITGKPSAAGTYNYTINVAGANGGSDAKASGRIIVNEVVVEKPLTVPANIIASSTQNAINLSWDAVAGAEKYIVKVCRNEEVIGGGGSGKSLIFNKSEITAWADGSTAATLKTGNGITIAQIGTQSKVGEYMQVGQGNTALSLTEKGKDAVLITAGEAIDRIVVTFSSNKDEAAKPYVGFSAGNYTVGSGNFSAELGCSNANQVAGTAQAAKTYACPAGTKSIILARNMGCDGTSSNVSFRISKIEVYLKGGSEDGGSTTTQTVCNELTATANSIVIPNLAADTEYTYSVKAVRGAEETAFSAAKSIKTKAEGAVAPLTVPENISATPAQNAINFAWNAVTGAEKYIVKLCRETQVEVPGSGEAKSLVFNKSEIAAWADGSAASTLKTGNGITIAQIGTQSSSGDYLQVGQGNAALSLTEKGKDAVLITAGEVIDRIVVTFGSNKDDAAAKPYVGFSAGSYTIGSGSFSAELGCNNAHEAANKTQVAKTYACPNGTKSIILARNMGCDGTSSNVTFRISKIEVYLKAGGSTTKTEVVCDETYETATNSINIGNLIAGTKYTYQIKAVRGAEQSAYSAAATVTTLAGYERVKENVEAIAETQSLNISIYPNPAKEVVYVQSDAQVTRVEIYSLGGALVMQENNFNESLFVSELPKGVYILRAYTDNGTAATTKLIKE